jgi:glucokinase
VFSLNNVTTLRGCLELWASATGLVRLARESIAQNPESGLGANLRHKPDFTAIDLFDLAKDGDSNAIQIFEAQGRALGRGLASLVNSLNLRCMSLEEAWRQDGI